MEIVIKIDKEDYKIMRHNIAVNNPLCPLSQEEMVSKVANGTPLPKGHGVLKDVTNLMRGLYTDMQTEEMIFTSSEVYKLIDEECPTTIEADKESEDD